MARIIKADGTVVPVSPQDGTEFTLEEMRQHIGGGHLETVPFTKQEVMYVDDEGVEKQFPLNEKASEMLSQAREYPVPVFGDAFIATFLETGDEEQAPPSLTDAQCNLRVPVIEIDQPCEECGATEYPNLQYEFPFVGKGVLCRTCLNKVVADINTALQGS